MRDGHFVVDGVVHAYNLDESNYVIEESKRFADGVYRHHQTYQRGYEQFVQPRDEFMSDYPVEGVLEAWDDAGVDVISYHGLPLWDYFHDGMSTIEKGKRLREERPGRVLIYAPISPLEGPAALDKMADVVENDQVDGIKLYPSSYIRGRSYSWTMDDEKIAFPVFERALELGIRNVAVHKALPIGPAPAEPFRVDDVVGAAAAFPEINFQVVHGGLAFIDETAQLLHRFKNVYMNLEVTMSYVLTRPQLFARALGEMLYWGTPEQLIFASGFNIIHPKPLIDAFLAFQMPESMTEDGSYLPLNDDDKGKILGGNFARLHDLNVAELTKTSAGTS